MPANDKEIPLSRALSRIAYDLAFNQDLPALQIWWHLEYGKPFFHDNMDDYTEEELILEFYIRKLKEDPSFKKQLEDDIIDVEAKTEEWIQKMNEDDPFEAQLMENIRKKQEEIRWKR